MKRILAGAAALAVLASGARANDSVAEMGAGGLVFVHTPDIRMESEDLFISEQKVEVRYSYLNMSDQRRTVEVAFPMPDVTIDEDTAITLPSQDPYNLMNFTTLADGRPAPAKVEQHAVFKGRDRTAELRSLGVPLAPHLESTVAALDRLPKAVGQRFVAQGLVVVDEYDAGKGMEHHLSPRWTLKTTYHWTQVFEPRRRVEIIHRYTPAVGASVMAYLSWPHGEAREVRKERAQYCADDGFMAALRKGVAARAPKDGGIAWSQTTVAYILTTGANWRDPIGRFRLVVDKGAPQNLVSFCGENVRQISPTTFEMVKTNFVPRRNLDILIAKPVLNGG
ncbi:MAG: DUF4424 domain-containing protein [Pseudomonadota bacterium]|jgi:hypothetical protein